MKIAIITQPLHRNYGGLLQNFALQQILIKMGHQPITFDQVGWLPPVLVKLKIKIKSFLSPNDCFEKFIKKYIHTTSKAKSEEDFRRLDLIIKPDAYIVGSDQVWRPQYNIFLDSSYLSFTDCKKKIAYAASFGTDLWEYEDKDVDKFKCLLNKFSAVSVREKSAITLCREHFNLDPKLVLDPTLLLNSSDYDLLIDKNKQIKSKFVFTYILNSSESKRRFVDNYCCNFSCCEVAASFDMNGKNCHGMSVENWVFYIKNSSFVICDSFHGTAFSIIMHKPFVVLSNLERGNTRMISLLELLGLQDRLICDYRDIEKLPNIDWNEVDSKIKIFRKESLSFIKKSLL